jgi:uncharacterized protein YndB with AHSA1/START domain
VPNHQTDNAVRSSVATTGRRRSVSLRRTFPATVDQLWDTCTTPDALARWYGTVTGDARVGGSVVLADVASTCEVLRCEPPNRLDVTWQTADETTVVSLLLRAVDGGTELTLEHLGIATSDAGGHGSGWERELGRLEAFLTGADEVASPESPELAESAARRQGSDWDALPVEYDVRWGRSDGADSVTIVRDLEVSRHALWTALTTASGLAGWFGTLGDELIVGRDWTVAFDDGTASGTVEQCVPGWSFRTTYRQGIDGPDQVHRVSVTLSEAGAASRLTLVHTFPADASPRLRTGMTAGWNAYLGALEALMSGRPVTDADWMADFRIALIALG